MLSEQFLLATQKQEHPNNINIQDPPPPRTMKKTLKECFSSEIQELIPDIVLNTEDYKKGLKHIHTKYVSETIDQLQHNKVLNRRPPEVNKQERSLSRKTRCILSQLRSGYSTYLNSYMSRIDSNIQNTCPNCQGTPHDTLHIFNCPSKPTHLTPDSLWDKPQEAANFLGLHDEEEI